MSDSLKNLNIKMRMYVKELFSKIKTTTQFLQGFQLQSNRNENFIKQPL